MKSNNYLDYIFVVHMIAAALSVKIISTGHLDVGVSTTPKGLGVLGVALIAGAVLIFVATLTFWRRVELIVLFVLFLLAAFSGFTWSGVLYLGAAIFFSIAWFLFWRKPPLTGL